MYITLYLNGSIVFSTVVDINKSHFIASRWIKQCGNGFQLFSTKLSKRLQGEKILEIEFDNDGLRNKLSISMRNVVL